MSSREIERRQQLIDRFVSTFEKFDEMTAWDPDPVALELAVGDPDQYDFRRWRPRKVTSDPSQFEPIYAKLPARFPPAFEQLVLSYRWAEVDLQTYRLVANPPGEDLSGLFNEVCKDKFLWKYLIHAGFVRFGKGPDMDYDPACFDISSRRKNNNYRIVKIDHEEILCNERTKIVTELASGFEELMVQTIDRAANL